MTKNILPPQASALDQALEALALAATRFGYDVWATATPPVAYEALPVKVDQRSPVTVALVDESLQSFFASMAAGQWDRNAHKVWFARRDLSKKTSHDDEWVIHPELVGIEVPRLVVDHFMDQAQQRMEQAAAEQAQPLADAPSA